MWIVKLGGSLLYSKWLNQWLDFSKPSNNPCIIVPGGGIFAKTVYAVDQKIACSSYTAHRMAILAMQQYGVLLHDKSKNLFLARDIRQIQENALKKRDSIWLPDPDIDITHSWKVTSDSIAAWLAKQISATIMFLVKSLAMNQKAISLDNAVKEEIIDSAFPQHINAKTDYYFLEKKYPELFHHTRISGNFDTMTALSIEKNNTRSVYQGRQ